jgi:hypothetical protein
MVFMNVMAIWVVEFSSGRYRIGKIPKGNY